MSVPSGPALIDKEPTPAEQMLKPFADFMQKETSGGILLIVVTVVAMVLANSPFAPAYFDFWQMNATFSFGAFEISKPILLWINDGLMAMFFFVVGLEIKREISVGELSSFRRAALPIAAAIGGMVVPALFYVAFNRSGEAAAGWGIPMATDIAFALGILALLGSRAPLPLKIFLTALAIIDDIGAVLVIALFYTSKVSIISLVVAGAALATALILNRLGVRNIIAYLVVGMIMWAATLKSGVHATIAGVLMAFAIPAGPRITAASFVNAGKTILKNMGDKNGDSEDHDTYHDVHHLKTITQDLTTPLQRLEHGLHPWTTYFVIPVFALANAGVALSFEPAFFTGSVTLGILAGLVLGKQFGVFGCSWLAVKLGWADLPPGVTWRHIYGVGALSGIGFTMSLFITGLAFSDPALVQMAKVGILGASLISGVFGYLCLRSCKTVQEPAAEPEAAQPATV